MDETIKLLELAAKAAQYEIDFNKFLDYGAFTLYWNADTNQWWNPKVVGGDALALSTDLSLNVFHTMKSCYAVESDCDDRFQQIVGYWECKDKHEATRLAIVRAAAKIGEQK